ncbi:MAG: ATP-dependent zinc metalloprotease FtsH [Nitrospira sp.]|jgi:cell division protease FtsH|uniref:ATP-dependent zinc metalloprotease FtsH n=1 Tax=Nitrospira sp. ND1 TaxID=1658518 RepID=UPI0009B98C4B|nr:ATP-dependent zinc metalloprotease FtsH [Nitrospira sp. ND1]MBK7421400.1 ATP-dependent zinc metalloprotease FtsH [Nitrospira sp.]OYT24528.1 MAG: cell division protein FtsH [Nitrospira sp. UW-LDO-02]MBK7487663.1 ATP-dependent zinc metalloprotease FtsH [Nitrospira sp.]MBP6198145.1 ATP-dependent zinc metalloprotease FtsH [Nitrospira sp.]MBP7360714.1 ATP-dependent zinc metalloprotease FtsH [Nitrospira sp.]
MDPKQRQFSIWYMFIALWVLILLQTFLPSFFNPTEIPYSEFKESVAAGKVTEVAVSPQIIHGKLKEDKVFHTIRIEDPDLLKNLAEHQVKVTGVIESTLFRDVLSWIVPIVLFFGVWWFLLRRMGQSQGFMTVGQSKAKIYVEKEVKVTFADVAGVDEAKQELEEIIEFLKTPEKFRRLGGKIPKGILLVGPPGTGKTLLAKAVAGEAGVPFFSISGSEFVEMFVGVGAARVRDLFEQAKGKAPCIIFLDELDALGKARGVGPMAHEEREQTLNQLLVEMDGFDSRVGVILVAATNRPEILDPALLRAGRFDRQVLVDRPDKIGRLAILKVHARTITIANQADLETIAAMTPGFVGADLANLLNEAALLAVRRGKDTVSLSELQEAVERVIGGLEKKNRVLNKMERARVAHHEVGHALVAMSIPGGDAVHKISIIPRGIAALGYTMQLPTEDRFLMTVSELKNRIAILLGGRAAEEVIYGEVSTGAQDDLRKATDIAKSMVKAYGMSEKLGQVSLERDRQSIFLQTGPSQTPGDYSEQTSREIDCEVRVLIDEQYEHARNLITSQEAILRKAAQVLLEKETISGEELKTLAASH